MWYHAPAVAAPCPKTWPSPARAAICTNRTVLTPMIPKRISPRRFTIHASTSGRIISPGRKPASWASPHGPGHHQSARPEPSTPPAHPLRRSTLRPLPADWLVHTKPSAPNVTKKNWAAPKRRPAKKPRTKNKEPRTGPRPHFTLISSTSKISASFGPMSRPAPRGPYASFDGM